MNKFLKYFCLGIFIFSIIFVFDVCIFDGLFGEMGDEMEEVIFKNNDNIVWICLVVEFDCLSLFFIISGYVCLIYE